MPDTPRPLSDAVAVSTKIPAHRRGYFQADAEKGKGVRVELGHRLSSSWVVGGWTSLADRKLTAGAQVRGEW